MIRIASFDSLSEANQHADLLARAGIDCIVEYEESEEITDEQQPGIYILLVAETDEADADMVLDSAEFEPEMAQPGQRNMLVGSVVGGVGLLTSFGDLTGIAEPWSYLPYGLVAIGAVLFVKGSREEKDPV